ncbi:MAG: 4'-phosphopantetheinyl transferase superfamily protein [Chloroflexota bacterium]
MQFLTRTLSDRFIVRRARLRMILSAYTGQNPGLIRYHIGDYGKPSIDAALAFNISHAEAYAVCAIWNGRQIGIDIEYHRAALNMLTIAKNYFSDDEQAELATLPASKRKQGFYTCWTRKEAVIKSDGRGLHISLASFSVTPLCDESVSVRLPDLDQPLYVRMLPITSQYTCAIAVESSSFTVRCWLAGL